jgi:hypothetical protein
LLQFFRGEEKMKRLSLIIFLVCLMTSSVFASYLWMQDGSYPLNWTQANQWDSTGTTGPPSTTPGVPPLTTTTEIKMITQAWTANPPAQCTVDSSVGDYTSVNTSVNGTLYINSGANIGFKRSSSVTGKNGLRVGSAVAGGTSTVGTVNQSGGAVGATMVYLGYAGGNGPADGSYVISGGSLTCSSGLAVGTGINAASGQNTTGKFTVDGPGATTISVAALRVGGTDYTSGTNAGTLEFKLGSGVKAIGCTSVNLDAGGLNSETDLLVSVISTPSGDILLVNNTGSAVVGSFDKLNGGSALESASITLGSVPYTLTYMYDSVSKTKGTVRDGTYNDIALVVPEPATIALLGLGSLIAVRRRKK